jgi:universal stress protein A
MITLKKVLVSTDFEPAGNAAFAYGRALAQAFGSVLHVLHVTGDVVRAATLNEFYVPSGRDWQAEADETARLRLTALAHDRDRTGPRTTIAIRTAASPAAAIIDYAREQEIDLIVIGTHGRGAVAHLIMGSVAERVVRTAPCPVLTVHHPEHEFVAPDPLVRRDGVGTILRPVGLSYSS